MVIVIVIVMVIVMNQMMTRGSPEVDLRDLAAAGLQAVMM